MGETELSDWFVDAVYTAARNLRMGHDLKNMPEGYWREVVDVVDTRARGSDMRMPIGWRDMLAARVGRDVRRHDGLGPE